MPASEQTNTTVPTVTLVPVPVQTDQSPVLSHWDDIQATISRLEIDDTTNPTMPQADVPYGPFKPPPITDLVCHWMDFSIAIDAIPKKLRCQHQEYYAKYFKLPSRLEKCLLF